MDAKAFDGNDGELVLLFGYNVSLFGFVHAVLSPVDLATCFLAGEYGKRMGIA